MRESGHEERVKMTFYRQGCMVVWKCRVPGLSIARQSGEVFPAGTWVYLDTDGCLKKCDPQPEEEHNEHRP